MSFLDAAGRGSAWLGEAWRGKGSFGAGSTSSGVVPGSQEPLGWAGHWQGWDRQGSAGRGKGSFGAGQSSLKRWPVRFARTSQGLAWQGRAGIGVARQGQARQGLFWSRFDTFAGVVPGPQDRNKSRQPRKNGNPMATITVSLTGTTPLLMHNERLANPFDPLTRQMKTITSRRKKTDEDLIELARIEFEGGLYWSDVDGPVIPTYNVKRSFVDGGRISKLGRHIERSFMPIGPGEARLEYDGPRTVDGLLAAGFADHRSVKVGTSKVLRCRPIFRKWALTFEADLDTAIINADEFQRAAETAGQMVGLGDFRQRFGRYSVEIA